MAQHRVLLNFPQRFAAVFARHIEVEQNQSRPRRARRIGILTAVAQVVEQLVDNDEARFPRDLLREWKSNAEAEALSVVGRPVDSTVTEPDPARLALMDHRFEMVCDDYKVRGTPKLMVDTFNDLSIEGKAALYDRAVMWKKGRLPKDNPYRR